MVFSRKKDRLARKKVRYVKITPLQKQLIAGALVLVVVSLVITAVYFASRIQSLQIEEVAVIGGQTIPHTIIKDVAERELQGTYLRLVPKRFIPLYPRERLLANIEAISRVKHVQIEITDNQTLTIVFEEYIPYALWCAEPQSETCLFLDATGYAFASSPELQGSALVRYIDEGIQPALGTTAFERNFIEETEGFVEQLENQLGLYVTHVFKRGAYDIEYTIGGGGVIKVSQAIPLQESFDNLRTILLSEEFKHITPGSFQYIDLRFGEKIFVNEEIAVPETDTATSSATSSSDGPED